MKLLLLILLFSIIRPSEPVAIVTKTRGKAYLNGKNNKIRMNYPVYLNDNIIVSKKSFIKIIFLDDGSVINIYPESSITVEGRIKERKIQKKLILNSGVVQAEINPQLIGKFKLVTNNSELACIECSFWAIGREGREDKFFKIEHEAIVLNKSVEFEKTLKSDSTLFSISGKDPYLIETSVSELKLLELLLLDAEEIIQTESTELVESDASNVNVLTKNILRIKLTNAANIERELILTFTQE